MARKIYTDFDFQSASRVTNLPNPSAAGDAVPKSYVDSAVEGLAWKDSCRVATQSNISLLTPGATIDGVTMASQDRVLVRAQTSGAENGIYVWSGASSPLVRSLDCSTFAELEQATTMIEEGTSPSTTYRQTAINGTLETTAIVWITFGVAAPATSETTAGLSEVATQAETDAGSDDVRHITPAKLANWSGRIRKFSANIGDGTATTYTVTHSLNSRDVVVRVYPNSGQYDDVEVDVQRTTVNAVALVFATAPASNAFRVVVVG
jgi:hypothetical protein